MKKILKFIKHNVLGLIAGTVIFGSLGVYAATVIAASNVGYSDNNDLGADNVQDAIDKLNTKATIKIKEAEAKCPSGNLCVFAKPGDYVKMTPTSTSYTITKELTGYNTDVIINPSELNLWRVINVNSDGTLDLVSVYLSSTIVFFKGKTGYQNFTYVLDQIAAQYANSKYTVATRNMGDNGQTKTITDTSILNSTTLPQSSSTSNLNVNSINEAKGLGDIEYQKDYNLVKNAIGTLKTNVVGKLDAYYWLASRCYIYESSSNWIFSGLKIDAWGNLSPANLYYNNNGVLTDSLDNAVIRPIVTLKANLVPSSGSGTNSSPYVLD